MRFTQNLHWQYRARNKMAQNGKFLLPVRTVRPNFIVTKWNYREGKDNIVKRKERTCSSSNLLRYGFC